MTVQSREIESDFDPQNCREFLVCKHLEENELLRYRWGLMQNETAKASHPVCRVGDLRVLKVNGKDFQVNKPLVLKLLGALLSLPHWKNQSKFENCELLWDAAGAEYFHRWLGYGNTVCRRNEDVLGGFIPLNSIICPPSDPVQGQDESCKAPSCFPVYCFYDFRVGRRKIDPQTHMPSDQWEVIICT